MIHIHAAFGHDLFHIPVGDGAAGIEEHGETDHVFSGNACP